MTSFRCLRSGALLAASITGAALAVTSAAPATGATHVAPTTPHVATNGAAHVGVSSAQLTAVIEPHGIPTSYYFQFGPSTAYGMQTPTVSVGASTTKVKVGQSIAGLLPNVLYHYRVVGVYGGGVLVLGKDRTLTVKGLEPRLELAKLASVTVGTPFILSGTLKGIGNAHHPLVLQASPYPYLESFATIGLPGSTDALGRFAFRVSKLSASTEFRVLTQDLRPLYSTTITVHAAVRVTLHVRSSGKTGLVRLYGTISPAISGGRVEFQVQKAERPNKNEETSRYVTQAFTGVKRGTHSYSRFSAVVSLHHGGRYRAYVRLGRGPLASGFSPQTFVLHAAAGKVRSKAA